MARSSVSFTAEAGRVTYPIDRSLEFLDVAHLGAQVDGTPVSATFDERARTVTLAAAASAGATVTIQRTTPRGNDDRLVDFLALANGSAGLTAEMLNTDAIQELFILGEGRDVVDALPDLSGMGVNEIVEWEGEGLRIEDLSLGVDASDAARKDQLDTIAAAARPLPTGLTDDDTLFVSAGEWDNRTPAQGRTHLGLGTVAPLTAGAGANNVAAFDSSAPPRYPTADGRNIALANHVALQADIEKRAKSTAIRWRAFMDSPALSGDPSVATWSQSAGTRLATNGGFGARVELENNSDVSATAGPQRILFSAGTWHVRWIFWANMPLVNSATNRLGFRITNDDDTSAQTIYYDLGVHRPHTDFSGNDYQHFSDGLVLPFASPSYLVFRAVHNHTGGSNLNSLVIFVHRIATSLIS